MSAHNGLAGFVAFSESIVLFSAGATQSRGQAPADGTSARVFKTISVTLSRSGVHWQTIRIEPNELKATNETLAGLIQTAYQIDADQISGAPNWISSERYDILAKVGNSPADEMQGINPSHRGPENGQLLLQALLSDRFKLAVHQESKLVPVYALVIASDGPKLMESNARADSDLRIIQVENGRIAGREVPIATLARILSEQLKQPVLDETGLDHHYDVTFQWDANPVPSVPAMSAALQEQLGLRLIPQLMSKEFIAIDHVEAPSAN